MTLLPLRLGRKLPCGTVVSVLPWQRRVTCDPST
jgi:hypothetical protein